MGQSRKDWIAARRTGERLGWYGRSPEAGALPVDVFRAAAEPFDTIVATALPEEGISVLFEQLREGGRLLVAMPFGTPYPSAIVNDVRHGSVPVELDLIDGEIRLVVDRKKPNVASWQMFASPNRLLAMTERGASERDAKRQDDLETLRSAYRRLAERLMARASEKAGPSIATASRVLVLEDRVADLSARLRSMNEATDTRVGRALLLAAKNPREAVRLPRRLLRAYVDSRKKPLPELPPPPPLQREVSSLVRRTKERLILVVDGRPFSEASGIERYLAMEGWSVVLVAKEEEDSAMRSAQRVVRAEIDLLHEVLPHLEASDAGPRVALFRSPHPAAVRWVNRLNAWGWVTIYDCVEDWPKRLRFGAPHRYQRAVERFLLHNTDVVTATRDATERLAHLTSRRIRMVEAREESARSAALVDVAATVKINDLPEKRFHARELG